MSKYVVLNLALFAPLIALSGCKVDQTVLAKPQAPIFLIAPQMVVIEGEPPFDGDQQTLVTLHSMVFASTSPAAKGKKKKMDNFAIKASDLTAVRAFYQTEPIAQGWSDKGSNEVKGVYWTYAFSKGDETILVAGLGEEKKDGKGLVPVEITSFR